MQTVDHRCTMTMCEHRTGIYRMVGRCGNCGTEPVLVLYTEGHTADHVDCPVCGCRNSVRTSRLATDDEIPVA